MEMLMQRNFIFSVVRVSVALLALAVWGCNKEAAPPTPTAPATAKSEALPAQPAAAVATPDQVRQWIANVSADDGRKRMAATQALFKLGPDAIEPLKRAGAMQISPLGTIATRRLDMIYSLVVGLELSPPGGRAGYTTNGFGLHADKDCTLEEVTKLGEKYGFDIDGPFQPDGQPACYVDLKPGKNLVEVLKAILSNEPRVVTVNLNYFVK
jgi:hypothetical protein